VSIAHSTSILSSDHTWDDKSLPIKYNKLSLKPVTIKSDVWLGCGVRILAGSFINKRVVIAAGAVVNKTIESNILAGGIPAKKIKLLE
ncbi:acyltransferase, partial [Marinilactibacillus psychrotolerans]|uniref:acyltransferase n=1 Tax=Marinilactibacillus psychrotolerans TaxID=191770 RepID=UPI001C7DEC96